MQRWCERIEAEVSTWPHVTGRPMFGLTAYYRGRQIFAAIPRTRAVRSPFALLVKLGADRDPRLAADGQPGANWATFELESEADIAEALRRLERAYDRARAPRRRRDGVRVRR
jgi:hypothetical protein